MKAPSWRWGLAFALITVIAYSSAIKAPFEYDDLPAIQHNPTIRELFSPAWMVPPPETPVSGRPVVNGSFALNYAVNEWLGVDQSPNPGAPGETVGYHVVNILVHLGTGLLLFGVIRRTLRRLSNKDVASGAHTVAGVATLLWLVHPIQTEALNYLTQRTELLVSLFYIATLYSSIRAWDAATPSARRGWYATAIALSALGMASKEVMITAPLMVVLYDRAFRARTWRELWEQRSRVAFYGGVFATSLIVVASVVTGQRSASVGLDLGVTWYEYLWAQAWAIATYLRLIVWPSALTFDYGAFAPTGWRSIPGVVLLVPLLIATVYAWIRGWKLSAAFLGAWFFLLLAPSSSVIPIKTEMAAERRIYLASAAIFIAVALGIHALARRRGPMVAAATTVVLTGALVATTFVRGLTYSAPETLYRDTMEKAPRNPRAFVSYGLAILQQGPHRFDEAQQSFRQAIAIDGENVVAWRSLGVLESIRGNWPETAKAFSEVLRRRPDNLDAIDGLGRAYLSMGQPDVARPYVDKMGTRDVELLWMLGEQLVQQKRGAEAIPYLEGAVKSGRPPALGIALLGVAYAQGGHPVDARKAAAFAVAAAGDTADVFAMAGRAMSAANDPSLARTYLQRALALDPNHQGAKDELAKVTATAKREVPVTRRPP